MLLLDERISFSERERVAGVAIPEQVIEPAGELVALLAVSREP